MKPRLFDVVLVLFRRRFLRSLRLSTAIKHGQWLRDHRHPRNPVLAKVDAGIGKSAGSSA